MRIKLFVIGKTTEGYLLQGIDGYCNRINRYVPFEMVVIPPVKNSASVSADALKKKESEAIVKLLKGNEHIILLEEKGKTADSIAFSKSLQELMNRGVSEIIFITGGAYGVHEEIRKKSKEVLSLSVMTFSHQLVRLIFTEQLYRAMTILKGEKYHHL